MPTFSPGGEKTGLRTFKPSSINFNVTKSYCQTTLTTPNTFEPYSTHSCSSYARLRAFPWTTWCSSSHRWQDLDTIEVVGNGGRVAEQGDKGTQNAAEFSVWWSSSIKMIGYCIAHFQTRLKCGQCLGELRKRYVVISASIRRHTVDPSEPAKVPCNRIDYTLYLARDWKDLVWPCS